MIMFTSMIQSTWETVLVAPAAGLTNGGAAGLFWSYIWTFCGFVPVVISLAEMASMAPTSGGQYHWVSEFAPRKHQKFLSYMSGWMATTSWQAGTAGASYFFGTMIQGTISAYNPNYVPTKWQGTLFVFATALVTGIINIFMVNQLPRIQKLVMIPHGLGWIPVIIFLWTLVPHSTAKQAFTQLESNGGWEPIGLSLMVGQVASVYFMILSDSAAHLSEEVKTASKSVPRAMVYSFFGNSLVGFIVLIAFIFALPDVETALSSPSGYAFMYVFQQGSYKGAIPLIVIVQMVVLTGTVDSNASTSRQTFAFARDSGLPLRKTLSKVTNASLPPATVLNANRRHSLHTKPCL
jgi:amino acid transporter